MVTPYITFSGCCRAALRLYQAAFEAPLRMCQPYGDYVPEGIAAPPDGLSEWILHAEMDICGTTFWFADEVAEPVIQGSMVRLTAQVTTVAKAQQIFHALSQDARITLPPTETFYSAFHAGLVDTFGVGWNIVALEPFKQT